MKDSIFKSVTDGIRNPSVSQQTSQDKLNSYEYNNLKNLIEAEIDRERTERIAGDNNQDFPDYNNLLNLIKTEVDRERTERIAGDKTQEKNIKYLTNTKTINSLFQYTKEGEYICSSIEDNLNLKNDLPQEIIGKCKFKLIVDNSLDKYITQTIITIPNEEYKEISIYIRQLNNNIWTEWKCVTNNAAPTIETLDKNVIHLNRTGVDSVTPIGTDEANPDNLNNFNAYDKPGEYYCFQDNIVNVLNKPDSLKYGFRLFVMGVTSASSASNFGTFQLLLENGSFNLYTRYRQMKTTGAWTDWQKMGATDTLSMLDSSEYGTKILLTGQELPDYCVCGPAADKDYIDLATIKTPGNYYSPSRESANDNILLQSVPEKMITSGGVIESGFRLQVIQTNHSVVTSNKTTTTYHAVHQVLIQGANNYDTTQNRIFFRSALYTSTSTGKVSNLSWTPWQKITTDKEFDNLDTNTIHFNTYRHAITQIGVENLDTSIYNNLDNIIYKKSDDTAHEFFCYKANIPIVKAATPTNHFPKTLTRAFRVFDLMLANYTSAKSDDTYGVQIIIEGGLKDGEDASIPSMFIRYYNTITPSFSEWSEFSYLEDVKGTASLGISSRYNTFLTTANTELPLYENKININALPVGSYYTNYSSTFKTQIYPDVLPKECIAVDESGAKYCQKAFKLWVLKQGASNTWMQVLFAVDYDSKTITDTRPLIFVRHSYGSTDPSQLIYTQWFKLAYGDDVGATFMLDGFKVDQLTGTEDLNDYLTPGNFAASDDAKGKSIINTPWYDSTTLTGAAFRLMVMQITAPASKVERVYQVMFTRHQKGGIYFRTYLGYGWTAWDTVASGTDLQTLSQQIQTEIKPKLDLKYDDVEYDATNHKLTLSSTSTNGASKDVDFTDIVNISDKKIGYVTYELNEEDKNYYMTFYDWEDESTRTQIARYKIEGGGGGGGGGGTFKVVNRTDWGYYTSVAETAEELDIKFCWSSVDSESTPTGNGIMTIKVNNVQKVKQSIEQYPTTGDPYIFNIKPYLGSGSNTVKVMVEDAGGNSRMMTFTINVISLSITSKFISSQVYAPNTELSITYNPVGSGTKTIHFDIDSVSVGTTTTAANNVDQEYIIPASKITSGAHIMNIYCTIDVEGTTVISNILTYSLLVSGGETVIVASPYDRQSTKEQYTTVIIPFNVYNKDSDETTIDITYDNIAYRQIVAQNFKEAVVSYTFKEVGDHVIKILYDNAVKCTFNFTITESSVDVYVETSNREVYLSAQGRSNSEPESTRSIWKDPDTEVDCTLNDFNYNTNGWIELTETDESGVERTIGETVLRINKAASLTVNFKPFEGIASTDPKIKGKTLEFRMAVRDVIDYDAEIINCYNTDTSGNINRGLKGTAKLVLLKGSSIQAKTNYKEDEYFTVSIVIANTQTSTKYVVYTYIDGVMCNATPFEASSEYFFQNPGVDIVLGCPTTGNASIDIGRIRIYKSDLNRTSVLNNVIADTGNVDDMIESYTHNKVIDNSGAINPQLIAEHAADLPYMYVTGELPPQKGQKTTVSVEYFDNYTTSKSFSATGVQMDIQGTSSKDYPLKNYKLKFKNGFDMTESGEHVAKYLLDDSLKATSVFTFKKDFASSEKANNTLISPYYNDILKEKIYKFPKQEEDDALRTAIWGKPIVMFHIVKGQPEFMGCYNFNLD